MSAFDLQASFERAKDRFGGKGREGPRRKRSDRGVARLHPEVIELVHHLASGQSRPRMTDLVAEVGRFSKVRGLRSPSRTALYRLLDHLAGHTYEISALPQDVRLTLHNVEPTARIPGAQLAFHCFNYGNSRALSFAAGLPWLDLHQARRKRGWRAKSRGVLDAVCRARGI